MASIQKRMWVGAKGDTLTRWDAAITRKGNRRRTRTFKTRGAAERWVHLTEAELERGTFKSTDVAERMTLRDAMRRYLQEVSPLKKSYLGEVSLASVIQPHLGNHPLLELDGSLLASYRDKRLAMKVRCQSRQEDGTAHMVNQPRLVSTQTVRHELMFIRRVIDQARREWGVHLPAGNPVDVVRLPKASRPRDRRLNGDEEQRLLEAMANAADRKGCRNAYLQPAFILAVETTMRRGEIVKLKWADVDMKRRIATLRDTKNGEDRVIALSSRAVKTLEAMPRSIDGRVLPLTSNALRLGWTRAVKRAGITGLRFHDLRHEAVSRLFEKGLNPMEVASVSGHKTLQMLKRYTHLKMEELALRLG